MAFNYLMHDRNIYKIRPNFAEIATEYPELRMFVIPDRKGKINFDFTNPNALRVLTKILLKKDFDLNLEIPDGFLIPTVPQRLNYILWIEDLLSVLPEKSNKIRGIDIGTGPCAIFSLLGARKNNWQFTSTETSNEAVCWALKNITNNNLQSNVKVMKVSKNSILKEVLSPNEDTYDFCLCNPPFFENIEEIRKKNSHVRHTIASFAKEAEIFAEGGEVAFVQKLIADSLVYQNRICLYSSMFGKKKSFLQILEELKSMKDVILTTTEFCQGNTVRWGIAWTFLRSIEFEKIEKPKPKKPKKVKPKPPLVFHLPKGTKDLPCTVKKMFNETKMCLEELQITMKVVQSTKNYAEILMKTDQNTWSHQRKKRRELLKSAKDVSVANQSPCGALLSTSCPTPTSDNKLMNSDSTSEGVTIFKESCSTSLEIATSEGDSMATADQVNNENGQSKTSNFHKSFTNSLLSDPEKAAKVENFVPKLAGTVLQIEEDFPCHEQGAVLNPLQENQTVVVLDLKQSTQTETNMMPDGNSLLSENCSDSKLLCESNKREMKFNEFPSPKKLKQGLYSDNDATLPCSSSKSSDVSHLRNNTICHEANNQNVVSKQIKNNETSTDVLKCNYEKPHALDNSAATKKRVYFQFKMKRKLKSDVSKSSKKCKLSLGSKAEMDEFDSNLVHKVLLFCSLKIRRAKDHVLLEMTCPPNANRESMHQVFQFLKNKFIV